MQKTEQNKLTHITRAGEDVFEKIEAEMAEILNKEGVVSKMESDLNSVLEDRLGKMGLTIDSTAEEVVEGLTHKVGENEDALYKYIGITRDDVATYEGTRAVFDKIQKAAFEITTETEGYFLKKEKAEEILRAHPPTGTIEYLHYRDVDELLEKEEVEEIMSALRFTEKEEWMHEAFDVAYSDFTFDDFERRPIELRVLGPQWKDVAEKFVAKKHHNVSHLKEFGVIFLNPINQNASGAFLRDFALFFHYFHEIAFYSRLFELHSGTPDFNDKLKSLLRGDVLEKDSVNKGEWLIVQRYLWKLDPNDPRLFLPRVNPESLHWKRGEQDLAEFGQKHSESGLNFWDDLDWVAGYFKNENGEQELVSFDMEDNAMAYVAKQQNDPTKFFYHQQEAIWNELFKRYIGEEERYKLILKNFDKGSIELA